MIKAVIFDMDGVLIDSEPVYLQRKSEYLRCNGVTVDEKQLIPYVGRRFVQMLSELDFGLSDDKLECLKKNFHEITDISYRELLFPDVIESMKELKGMGLKLAIASNGSLAKIESLIKECRLEEYLEIYISGDEVVNLKPYPDIYLEAARRLGILPEECIAVEDSDTGIWSARDAGCYVAAKRDGRFGFRQDCAMQRLKSLRELVNIVEKMKGE